MGNETEEALHHAEHAHHTNDPFDRLVAMTMAIVAALLACVTMLSHRAHNDTLRLQGDANRLQTEADILHTRSSDAWNFYQAKNTRNYQNQAYLGLLEVLAGKPGDAAAQRATAIATDWKNQVKKYSEDLPKLQAEAEALVTKAHALEHESGEKLVESEHLHHRAARLDLGELGVELALVLCSLAVLAKRRELWLLGIVSGVIGGALAASAFVLVG
jgi:hypothetical protein